MGCYAAPTITERPPRNQIEHHGATEPIALFAVNDRRLGAIRPRALLLALPIRFGVLNGFKIDLAKKSAGQHPVAINAGWQCGSVS